MGGAVSLNRAEWVAQVVWDSVDIAGSLDGTA
jgi:hypothetical protein